MSTKKMHPPAVIHPTTGQTGGKGSLLPVACGKTTAKDRQNVENIVPSQNGTASSGAVEPQQNGNAAVSVPPTAVAPGKKAPNAAKTVAPAAATAVQSRRKNHRHSNMSPSRKRQEQQTIFNSLRAWNVKIVTQEKCPVPVSTTTTTTSSNEATAAKVTSVPTQTDKSSSSAVNVGKPAAASSSSNTSSSSSISNVTSSNSIKAKKQQSQLMVAATVPVQGTKETAIAVVGKGEQQQKKVEVATATENQPAAKKEPAPSSAGSTACETGSKADGKTTVGANASGAAPTTAGKDERKLLNGGTNSFGGRHSVAIPPPPSSLTAPSSSSLSASSSAGSGSSLLLHSSSSSPVGAAIPVVSTTGSGNCSSSKHSSSRASNAGKVLLPNVNPLEQFAVLQGKLRNSMTAPPLSSQQSHHNHAHHPHSSAAHNHQQQSQQQQQQSIPSTTTTSPQYSLDFLHYVGMRMSGTGGTTPQSTAAAAAQAAALFRGNPHFNYSNFNQQLHPQQQPTQQQQQQHLQRHYSGYYEEMMVPMGGTGGGDAGPPLYNGGSTGYPVADHLVNGAATAGGNSTNNAGGDSLPYCYSQSHQHNQHQNQHHLQHNHPPQQPYGNGSFHQNNNYQQHNRNYGRSGQPNGNMQGRKTWNNNNSWHGNGKRSNMMQGGKYGGGINGFKGPNVSHGGYRKSYNYYNNNSNHHNYHNHTNGHHHDPHQQQHQDHLRSLRYIGRGQGDASSSQESTSRSPTPSPQSESPAIDTASDVAKASNTAGSSASSVQDEKSDSGIEDGAATLKKSGAVPSSSSSSSSVVSIPSTDSSAISSAVSQNLSLELNGATGHGYESDSSHSSSYNSHSYRHRKYANGGQVYRSSSSTSSGVSSTATFPPLVADFAMQTSASAVNTPTASATSQQVADLFLRSQSYHGSHQNLTTVSGSASPNPPDSPVGAARPLVGTQSMPMFSELFTGQQHHNLHNHHHPQQQQQQTRTRPNSSYGSNSSLDSTLQNVIAGTPASASASSNNSNCSIVSNTSSSGYGSAPTSTVPPNEAYSMQSGHPRRRFSGRSSPAPYTEQSHKPNRSSFGGSINTAVNSSSQQQPPSPPSHSRKGQQPAWNTHRPVTVPTSTATTAVPPPAPQVPPPSTSVPPPPAPTANNLPLLHPIDGGTNYHTPADRFLARSHLVELLAPPQDLAPAGSKWAALSGAVWDKFASAQQTQHKFVQKIQLWRYLFMCIRKAFPRFSLYLVGSTISGFASDNSDVDMCLVCRANTIPFDMRGEALFQLGQLKNYFMNINTYFEEFSVIQAKVPILRFRDSTNSIVVDLNYNNCVGIRNTHLLYCYSQLDWRLRPLTLVVKLWAQHHNINDAKNMTISSYSLVLMVIHFLQYGVSPPILPCLHAMYPDKFVDCPTLQRMSDISNLDLTETMEPYKNDNAQPLGELFMQFLEYYANFDYTQYAISVRTASVIPIESARVARSYKNDPHHWRQLCIEEPFDLTNTARSVFDAEIFEQIKSVFSTSWRRLKDTNDLGSIFECDPLFIPVASTLSITS